MALFCRIANHGRFSLAARELGLTASQASRDIANLEHTLGVRLFERTTRKVRLSIAGEQYLPFAQAILAQHSQALEALHQLNHTPRGVVRFSAPEIFGSVVLPPLLATFTQHYPEIDFDLHCSDEVVDLLEQPLDFALRTGFLDDDNLAYRHLGHYQRWLCASPAYLAQAGVPNHPSELIHHRCLLHSAIAQEAWWFRTKTACIRHDVQAFCRCNTSSGLYRLALAGMGITRLAEWAVQEAVSQGQLCIVCPDYPLVSANGNTPALYAVFPSRQLSHRARVLLDYLTHAILEPLGLQQLPQLSTDTQ